MYLLFFIIWAKPEQKFDVLDISFLISYLYIRAKVKKQSNNQKK
jgi:hypothetical protein